MPTLSLNFNNNPAELGVTAGDSIYYIDSSNISTDASFSVSNNLNNIILIGSVTQVINNDPFFTIAVSNTNPITPPTANDYIFFSKNNLNNQGSVLGYYADLKFTNDSTEFAEIFQITVGAEESSK